MPAIVALFSSVADGNVVAVYFIVYQRIENYLILPRVMGKAIDQSAPTVIITLLIGSSPAGLGGRSDRAPDRRCPQGRYPGGPAEHLSALCDRVATFRVR